MFFILLLILLNLLWTMMVCWSNYLFRMLLWFTNILFLISSRSSKFFHICRLCRRKLLLLLMLLLMFFFRFSFIFHHNIFFPLTLCFLLRCRFCCGFSGLSILRFSSTSVFMRWFSLYLLLWLLITFIFHFNI